MYPLYGMRQYHTIWIEGEYKIISTHKNRYVLDLADTRDTTYSFRRLELLRRELPYKIYPITEIIRDARELALTKTLQFYTDNGKLLRYKKKRFVPRETRPILDYWLTDEGRTMLQIQGVPTALQILNYNGERYAEVLRDGKSFILMGVSNEPICGRKKI